MFHTLFEGLDLKPRRVHVISQMALHDSPLTKETLGTKEPEASLLSNLFTQPHVFWWLATLSVKKFNYSKVPETLEHIHDLVFILCTE